MDPDEETQRAYQRGREAFLVVVLTVLVGGAAVVLLTFVTQGYFAFVLLIGAGIGLFAVFHYWLWGRSFTEQLQQEREDQEKEQDAPGVEQPQQQPWERRF